MLTKKTKASVAVGAEVLLQARRTPQAILAVLSRRSTKPAAKIPAHSPRALFSLSAAKKRGGNPPRPVQPTPFVCLPRETSEPYGCIGYIDTHATYACKSYQLFILKSALFATSSSKLTGTKPFMSTPALKALSMVLR